MAAINARRATQRRREACRRGGVEVVRVATADDDFVFTREKFVRL